MESTLLYNLAIVMVVAGVVTFLFRLLGQPVVLGYILAGFVVGPGTPQIPVIVDQVAVETLSELGIVFLLFSLGLDFNLRKLARVGMGAAFTAVLEISVMLWIGFQLGRLFGWNTMDSVFLGAIMSITSSTIMLKTLQEMRCEKEAFAQVMFGLSIVEDILGVCMLALLSGIALTGEIDVIDMIEMLVRMGVFLTTLLVLGLLLVPRLLRYITRFNSNEMLLVVTLALCFGVALLAQRSGFSTAMGAFLIGAIVSEARERGRIVTLIEPLRDTFSAVFFVTIGMMIRPEQLAQYWAPVLCVAAAVMAGKLISNAGGAFAAGYDSKTALRVGTGMAQIGEFSFVIAAVGLSFGVIGDHLYPIAVSSSAITILCMPYLLKNAERLHGGLARLIPHRVATYGRVYHAWISRLANAPRTSTHIQAIVRRSLVQILLNLVLVAGLLVGAASLSSQFDPLAAMGIVLPAWLGGSLAMFWLAAVLLSMPLIIATLRKIHAVAMIVAEMAISRSSAKERTDTLRAVVVRSIVAGGVVFVCLWLVLLSTAILPPWPVLIVLIVLVLGITAAMWGSFIRFYARAQVSLRETLSRPIEHHEPHEPRPLPSLLQSAQLETVTLAADSIACGKLIRELEVRSQTGASVIGIERRETSIVNPGADEELHPGDRILLLGSTEQLEAARKLFGGNK